MFFHEHLKIAYIEQQETVMLLSNYIPTHKTNVLFLNGIYASKYKWNLFTA